MTLTEQTLESEYILDQTIDARMILDDLTDWRSIPDGASEYIEDALCILEDVEKFMRGRCSELRST